MVKKITIQNGIVFLIVAILFYSFFYAPVRGWTAEGIFTVGNYYFGGGAYNLSVAEVCYDIALKLDPTLEGPHYQLARIDFIRGDFNNALAEINTELALHPDFRRSYYVRGLIYGYSNEPEKAVADFKTFLEWKPDSWAGHNDLAWVYFQAGKYIEARDTARAGLQIAPNNPWLLNSLGVALLNTSDTNDAREVFTRALAIINSMGPKDWGKAYPGNDPSIYAEGFSKMKKSIEANLQLLGAGDIKKPSQQWGYTDR